MHNDYGAYSYAQSVMKRMPADAIVFVDHDDEYFPLLYFQTVKKQRNDLIVIASTLLPNNWYFEQLSMQYPKLILQDYIEVIEDFTDSHDIQLMTKDEQTGLFIQETEKTIIELNLDKNVYAVNISDSNIEIKELTKNNR
jgi:hypothetical protein